jgi:glutamine amidotransferase
MGNLRSVQKALARVGAGAEIISDPKQAVGAHGLVLPGVGAFGQGMERLSETGFDDLVKEWGVADRPFLGICLGMQLLFGDSEEFGLAAGLGVVPGHVLRFRGSAFEPNGDEPGLKVPHMGWNTLRVAKGHPVLRGVGESAMAYFVHSYYCIPDDPTWTAVTTEHGIQFTSAVARGNLFASQFHPEKSGDVGLRILENFVRLVSCHAEGGA